MPEPCGTEANMAKMLRLSFVVRRDMCIQTHGASGSPRIDTTQVRETRLTRSRDSTNLILSHVATTPGLPKSF